MDSNHQCLKVDIEQKSDFYSCMGRIYAWYNQKVIYRVSIRLSAHNAEYSDSINFSGHSWNNLKERWWNIELKIELSECKLNHSTFHPLIILILKSITLN